MKRKENKGYEKKRNETKRNRIETKRNEKKRKEKRIQTDIRIRSSKKNGCNFHHHLTDELNSVHDKLKN